jgi:integrase
MKLRVTVTFSEFAELYLERYAKPHKRTWQEDEGRLRLYMVPAWGDRFLDSITVLDVTELHTKIGKHAPYQANRMLENLSKMFTLAKQWNLLPADFQNPVSGVTEFKETSRVRFLSKRECSRLMIELSKESNPFLRAAVLLLLLTGLRRNEILKLEWKNVNLEERWIKVIDKNAEFVFQPLTRHAVAIIASLPRNSNPYVIAGEKPNQPRNTIQKAWNRIRTRAQIQDVTIHDLRRSVGAWLATSGYSLPVIKEVLNHKDIETTLIYARLPSTEKRAALDSHSNFLADLLLDSESA